MEFKILHNVKISAVLVPLTLFLILILLSCKSEPDLITSPNSYNNDSIKTVPISGQVVDNATGFPIDSALVRILGSNLNIILYTEPDGQFFIEGEVDVNENLLILTYKQNYRIDSTDIVVTNLNQVNIPQIRLEELTAGAQHHQATL